MFRTDDGRPYVVRRFRGNRDRSGVWDGQVAIGADETAPAPDGDYAFTVAVRDRAGNRTEAPAPVPSSRTARPGTGVTVRNFSLSGPLDAVSAGSVASSRSDRSTVPSSSCCPGSAIRRRSGAAGAWAGRSGWAPS